MRVLHVSSGNLYGGVETALVTLARFRHLCAEMDQQFALSFEGRLSRELNEAGVPVYQLGEVRTRKPWTIWAARKRLRELLRRESFDVVICHMFWPMAIFGVEARRSGSRLAFWAHGAANGRHWLERWAGRVSPDLVIGNSLYTQATVPAVFPDVPCSIVHYPVAMAAAQHGADDRTAVRRELAISEESVVIIQVSRMEVWKGHRLNLEALSSLRHDSRWVCLVVGGAQRRAEREYMLSVQSAAQRLGISGRVQFLGQRTDVSRLLSAADIFSQPNEGPEPFGIVFIEAMSAGLPVVTTAMGGPREIIDDSCGVTVPPGRPELLAESLRELIDSAELRSRLGANGPERARQLCDPGRRIAELHDVLRRVVQN